MGGTHLSIVPTMLPLVNGIKALPIDLEYVHTSLSKLFATHIILLDNISEILRKAGVHYFITSKLSWFTNNSPFSVLKTKLNKDSHIKLYGFVTS